MMQQLSDKQIREAQAMSRLAKMRIGRRQFKTVGWPGSSDLGCKLQVITCSETQECYAAAVARFKQLELPLNEYTAEQFADEIVTQLLTRACRDAENPDRPFAIDADDLRDNTTVDERAAMMIRYRDFAREIDPDPTEMSAEDVRDILDAIKKKDKATLCIYGSPTLATFLLSMASRLAS